MCILKGHNGRKKVNQLHSVISNRDINLIARRLLLLSVIRPSTIWEDNKGQVAGHYSGGSQKKSGLFI